MPNPKLIALDFTEHDTIEATKLLAMMAERGEISGMVFAVQLANTKRARKVMLGATGRPANDLVVATGLSAILHCNITQAAVNDT